MFLLSEEKLTINKMYKHCHLFILLNILLFDNLFLYNNVR